MYRLFTAICVICKAQSLAEVILYIPGCTARMVWVAEEIFLHRGGLKISITENQEAYLASGAALKINYSEADLSGHRIYRSGFLDGNGIQHDFIPATARIADLFCLFPDREQANFDLLAMVFWCLSRYEEYQPFAADRHGRFPASASLLQKWGVLDEPICDIAIRYCFREWGIADNVAFTITPTLDIDIAFAYAGRGLLRGLGASLIAPWSLPGRIKSILQPSSDPNNTFDYISKALEHCSGARIFWHCGAENNHYDKQVNLNYGPFKQAISRLNVDARCGLHPSFAASGNAEILKQEKLYLEQILGREVTSSRMHYILLSMPSTYRTLIECGIAEDYSMGFPDAAGFRAGTAQPFRWYDLANEEATQLLVHPFCIMEATCKYYLQMSPEQAIDRGLEMKERLQRYGGDFCFIFHNESLGRQTHWRGWDKVFESWLA
jgi:hypothetical protein